MNKKQKILSTLNVLAGSFMYYDRKEDEDLGRGEVEKSL